jgi:uncharacterized protein (DUF1778 family)
MSSQTHRSTEQRDTRLNLRMTSSQAELIRRAAESTNQTVTDFVVGSTAMAAQRVLADRRWFALDDVQWADFEVLLARPVVFKSRLSERLNAPDPFVD